MEEGVAAGVTQVGLHTPTGQVVEEEVRVHRVHGVEGVLKYGEGVSFAVRVGRVGRV